MIVAYRVGWPDEAFLHSTLSTVRAAVTAAKITRTALIFVGKGLTADQGGFRDSALYDSEHAHVLRPVQGALIRLTLPRAFCWVKCYSLLAQSSFG